MIDKVVKVTALSLLISMGVATPSQAQFEMNNANSGVEVSSIPFVVALRKIVPVEYDFSFETEQDLGQVISYTHTNDWNTTLSNLLSEMSLAYKLEDDVVYIYNQGSTPLAETVEVKETPVLGSEKAMMSMEADEVVDIEEELAEVEEIEGVPVWDVKKGFTLQETIKSWGETAEWSVIWETDRDFDIQSEVSFEGTFVEAASALISAFEKADPPVVGTFYKNNTLVIETTSNGEVN